MTRLRNIESMENRITRESVLDRVRQLPEDLLEEADLLIAELTPISDEEWLKMLSEAPIDDEPLSLKELIAVDREHERRAERRRGRAARGQKRAI